VPDYIYPLPARQDERPYLRLICAACGLKAEKSAENAPVWCPRCGLGIMSDDEATETGP
jgi:DNA-directed RNA polymerase subunit RPC12/RpoP